MKPISITKLPISKFETSNSNPNIHSITQEQWYLELACKEAYKIVSDQLIWFIPSKNILFINQAFIPPYIQRIDPIPLQNNLEIDANTLTFILSHIKCGLLSISNKLTYIPNNIHEQIRNNYILPLNQPYDQLYKKFRNGHKLNLKHCDRMGIEIQNSIDPDSFSSFYNKYSNQSIISKYKNKNLINKLINQCLMRNYGFILNATNKNKEILAQAFFTKYNNRIVYLISCSTQAGKKDFAMHAILNHVIKTYSNQNAILDFEGSMIPGIAYFMQGFGSINEPYFVYKWESHFGCKILHFVKKLIRFKKG
ncbi:MAG: hypothetical protein WAR77_12640 [Saprospiraceae bacterium]|nr:hypothetical protein [Saprospiraceae bacterium]